MTIEPRVLDPRKGGRWLVTTTGSEHVFDLDAGTYTRNPKPGHGSSPLDGRSVRLTRVERWPAVGQSFLIWCDDPDDPAIEHWRLSSTVLIIEPAPANEPGTA